MLLLIDNYDSFTWNLVQRLGELDPSLEPDRDLLVVRNDKITPDDAEKIAPEGPSHIIISPGPCTPAEAGVSSAIIERFSGRVPVLGVCLGHQCIAGLEGIEIIRHAIPMHGKTSRIEHDGAGVFSGVPSPVVATRYHSLVVPEEQLPPPPAAGQAGWTVSAWTIDEIDNRAVRVVMGLRRIWDDPTRAPLEGVQFHPESFLTAQGPRMLANFLQMGDRPRPIDPVRVEALTKEIEASSAGA